VHDFFEVLGLPRTAPASEVRRVCARRARRAHPDFRAGLHAAADGPGPSSPDEALPATRDAAIDFVEMEACVDRMQASFFGHPR
jgi:hypothetical protein